MFTSILSANWAETITINNKQIIKTWKGILNKETEILRQQLKSIGQQKEGNLGKVNKLSNATMALRDILYTIQEPYSRPVKTYKI